MNGRKERFWEPSLKSNHRKRLRHRGALQCQFFGENDGKAWLQHIVEEAEKGDLTRDQLSAQVHRAADRSPDDCANFLKKPFFIACQSAKTL